MLLVLKQLTINAFAVWRKCLGGASHLFPVIVELIISYKPESLVNEISGYLDIFVFFIRGSLNKRR